MTLVLTAVLILRNCVTYPLAIDAKVRVAGRALGHAHPEALAEGAGRDAALVLARDLARDLLSEPAAGIRTVTGASTVRLAVHLCILLILSELLATAERGTETATGTAIETVAVIGPAKRKTSRSS